MKFGNEKFEKSALKEKVNDKATKLTAKTANNNIKKKNDIWSIGKGSSALAHTHRYKHTQQRRT